MRKLKTMKAVHVHDGDEDVEILLKAWIKAIERYTGTFPSDNPWWYNERASLSVLAGAAWTIKDWFALEEFSTLKRLRTVTPGVDEGHLRNGRCDLFICSPRHSFALEAKQANQSIGDRSSGAQYVSRAIKAAWEDSGDLVCGEGDRRFGATFVVPTIPRSEVRPEGGNLCQICPQKVEQYLKSWLTDDPDFIGQSLKSTQFAYIFPRVGNADYILGKRYYPGIVLILEERYRATRIKKSG